MANRMRFQVGDEVAHPRRPEWGTGQVRDISAITHEGVEAQRVTVDWANHKRVAINTGIASLTLCFRPPQDDEPNPLRQPSQFRLDGHNMETKKEEENKSEDEKPADTGWLEAMENSDKGPHAELYALPDACLDPFATPQARLKATLETFRFSRDPRSLMDWAVMQTKLNDPLGKYTRSQLEQAFPRFERDRNQHLWSLIREFKHRGALHQVFDAAEETRLPAAMAHLEKVLND